MIWFALLIPIFTIVLLLVFFRDRVAWWEVLVPLVATPLLIFIAKSIALYCLVSDTEYWTGYLTEARYYEGWTEHEVITTTDSKGRTHRQDIYIYHPPYWEGIDNNDLKIPMERTFYDSLRKQWANQSFHVQFNLNQSSIGDGNMYSTSWTKKPGTEIVATTTHRYENRIQATRNVFDFIKVSDQDKQQFGVYDYPNPGSAFLYTSLLGSSDTRANRRLDLLNAHLGHAREVRIWVLVFWDKPVQAAKYQEAAWLRGNKNELVVCIGLSRAHPDHVQWCEAFSWCDREKVQDMHERLEMDIQSQAKFDWNTTIDILEREVTHKWARKNFHDFDYINLTVPPWTVWLTYFLTLVLNIGLAVWVVANEATADNHDFALGFQFEN